ncbi:hypothetical protein P3T65_26985 [Pseudomonas nitroreducens]|uniref:hypothetical protein n=1 Tax=Pseudomonas nitroreducens TaxID=46680 RepID=UPI0023F810A3|nr:hypothetical protein [Pseudomonas nitroreducens]WEW97829.1 hypothetical protein P3T65_26985 [Pseudomonas nitroreducens]
MKIELPEKFLEMTSTGTQATISLIDDAINGSLEFRKHPLGFVVCNVWQDSGKKLRLHIWEKEHTYPQDKYTQIHDHIFNLRSWVLNGSIENIEYVEDDNNFNHTIFKATYTPDTSTLNITNEQIGLIETDRNTIRKGESYSIPAGKLHKTEPTSSDTTITLVYTEDTETTAPRVIIPNPCKESYTYHRKRLSKNELRELKKNILELLN